MEATIAPSEATISCNVTSENNSSTKWEVSGMPNLEHLAQEMAAGKDQQEKSLNTIQVSLECRHIYTSI